MSSMDSYCYDGRDMGYFTAVGLASFMTATTTITNRNMLIPNYGYGYQYMSTTLYV